MNILDAGQAITPFIARIDFPLSNGTEWGTGFFVDVSYGCLLVATAEHVVEKEDRNKQPIELVNSHWPQSIRLNHKDLVVNYPGGDTAIVYFPRSKELINFQAQGLRLLESDMSPSVGDIVGYAGFPNFAEKSMHVFYGKICKLETRGDNLYYYIESAADFQSVKGTSGGPVFWVGPNNMPYVIGIAVGFQQKNAEESTQPNLIEAVAIDDLRENIRQEKELLSMLVQGM